MDRDIERVTASLRREGEATDRGVPSLGSRWTPLRRLGRGGQAEVWLARDERLETLAAVKIFDANPTPSAMHRLRREIGLGRDLIHPNLVRCYELVESADCRAIAMEWLPGGSLKDRLESGPLPVDLVIRIADGVLLALSYLHERGIIHRDVKPSNVLLDANEGVHLGDLGLIRPLDEGSELTGTVAAVGTPRYMSPEQLRNDQLTAAADLYGLGVSIFELLTGEHPFGEGSAAEITHRQREGRVPDPRRLCPGCPAWLARFTMRLLEPRATDRWSDAKAAHSAFLKRRTVTSPRFRRRLAVLIAVTIGLAGLAAATWYRLATSKEQPAITTFTADGSVLHGYDRHGRERWQHTFASVVQQVVEGDLNSDGLDEAVAVAYPKAHGRAESNVLSEVVVVSPLGELLTQVRPESNLTVWPAGFRRLVMPFARLVDVDGDGWREVLLFCTSTDSCHSALVVYWPRWNRWEQVFLNSGYIGDAVPVRGATPPRLRILAYNNNLAMVETLSQLVLQAPTRADRPFVTSCARSVDERAPGIGEPPRLDWSVPLPQLVGGEAVGALTLKADGETHFLIGGRPTGVDRFGNPTSGPNEGRDLVAQRALFFARLVDLRYDLIPQGPQFVRAAIADLRAAAGPLLSEASYRAILGEAEASALAKQNDLAGAEAALIQARVEVPYEDLTYRLALVQAATGRLATARTLLEPIVAAPSTPAGDTRGFRTLLFVAAAQRDEDFFRNMLATRPRPSNTLSPTDANGIRAALWARARLWWDRPEEADTSVTSWDLAPEGAAVACLTRWLQGQAAPGDPSAMQAFVRENPDMSLPGGVAEAAAWLATGQPTRALAILERLNSAASGLPIDFEDPEAFLALQFHELAKALHARALLDAGRTREAAQEALSLRATLNSHTLPGILVARVIRDTAGGTGIEEPGGEASQARLP